jgi:nitrogen regulatory protein P-II 2
MSDSAHHPHHGTICLITVVAENVLEARLTALLRDCGAKGWTITAARGEGPRSRRVGDLDGGNVRIESLVPHDVADLVLGRLEEEYFPHYAVVAWVEDVEVRRVDHFR